MRHENFNMHWRQYTDLCFPCDIDYDFIGKMDTILQDSQAVLSHFNTSIQLPYANANKRHTHKILSEFYKDVPLADTKRIIDIYKKDFQLFGYNATDYLMDIYGRV